MVGTQLPRETTAWTTDSQVIRSCTLKRRQICEYQMAIEAGQRFSLEKAFIIQDSDL